MSDSTATVERLERRMQMLDRFPEPWKKHFPVTPSECDNWKPVIFRSALHYKVLCVATTRIEGAWAAYCAPVPGSNHDNEMDEVLRQGSKLYEPVARALFPRFDGVPYAP